MHAPPTLGRRAYRQGSLKHGNAFGHDEKSEPRRVWFRDRLCAVVFDGHRDVIRRADEHNVDACRVVSVAQRIGHRFLRNSVQRRLDGG
jgi:hypothetical protein